MTGRRNVEFYASLIIAIFLLLPVSCGDGGSGGGGDTPAESIISFTRTTTANDGFNSYNETLVMYDNGSCTTIEMSFPNPPMVFPEWHSLDEADFDNATSLLQTVDFFNLGNSFETGGNSSLIYIVRYETPTEEHAVSYYDGATDAPDEFLDLIDALVAILEEKQS